MARDPGKGSFHHPSSGQHMEAFGDDGVPVHFHPFGSPDAPDACPGMLDNFEANTEVFLHPSLEGVASIPTICPDHLKARQLSHQSGEQYLAPFTISDTRCKHFYGHQEPQCVHQHMPFAAPDFFLPRRSLLHRHERDCF